MFSAELMTVLDLQLNNIYLLRDLNFLIFNLLNNIIRVLILYKNENFFSPTFRSYMLHP
jgi:hypothetical protein